MLQTYDVTASLSTYGVALLGDDTDTASASLWRWQCAIWNGPAPSGDRQTHQLS